MPARLCSVVSRHVDRISIRPVRYDGRIELIRTIELPSGSPLFPYTTLFRSDACRLAVDDLDSPGIGESFGHPVRNRTEPESCARIDCRRVQSRAAHDDVVIR